MFGRCRSRRLTASGSSLSHSWPQGTGSGSRATNGVYLGRSKAKRKRVLPDGTVLHGRTLAKIRKRDRGWRYAAGLLELQGAEGLKLGFLAAGNAFLVVDQIQLWTLNLAEFETRSVGSLPSRPKRLRQAADPHSPAVAARTRPRAPWSTH
jgi:hypothetical protein